MPLQMCMFFCLLLSWCLGCTGPVTVSLARLESLFYQGTSNIHSSGGKMTPKVRIAPMETTPFTIVNRFPCFKNDNYSQFLLCPKNWARVIPGNYPGSYVEEGRIRVVWLSWSVLIIKFYFSVTKWSSLAIWPPIWPPPPIQTPGSYIRPPPLYKLEDCIYNSLPPYDPLYNLLLLYKPQDHI